MVLLQIGVLDITPFIVLNSYSVSKQPDFEPWKDGNGTERRGIKSRKLKGKFNVRFFTQENYVQFLNAIETNKTIGDNIEVTIYDNKARETKVTNVYLDYEPANLEPSAGWSFTDEIEITVTER